MKALRSTRLTRRGGAPLFLGEPEEGPGIFGLPFGQEESLIQLLAAPFDMTVSYGSGTARGPEAIFRASPQIDLVDLDFGRAWRAGIHHHHPPALWHELNESVRSRSQADQARRTVTHDLPPDLAREVNVACGQMNEWILGAVAEQLADGRIVGLVGGEHSVAFAAILAHARVFGDLGVLQFDAHMDLRRSYLGCTWSHASVMANVLEHIPQVQRLVQVGVRDFCDEELELQQACPGRIRCWTDGDLRDWEHSGLGFADLAQRLVADLPRLVYVTFDIDGLDPTLCPHTGTPVPGGLSFHQASTILKTLVLSGRQIVGFDLCEVAPGVHDEWDANVGARVLYKLIGATLSSRITSLSRMRGRPGW